VSGEHSASQPGHAPPAARSRASDLAARVASALVMAPLAIAFAYVGGWPFVAFWTLAAAGIMWEWAGLAAAAERRSILLLAVPALGLAGILAASGRLLASLIIVLVGAGAAGVLSAGGGRGWIVAGFLYAGTALWAPAVLRSDPDLGFFAIVFLFAVVWATDILGFFVGRAVGGPKLCPGISPNKTWAGALGGAAGAVGVATALAACFAVGQWLPIGIVAFVLSVIAQFGDLFESAVKRHFGVKDASHIIPGHGGLMDRLDGFLAAALAGTVVALARGGFDTPAQNLLVW
jgi:phosphatidate cytidylyltransferase